MGTVANASSSKPRVLVVDDDQGIRMAIRTILEAEYLVTEAESIKESLAIFDRQPQDLVTLDIQMPEVDGMKGLSEFRHRSGKLPIILISGYRTFELAREALRLGANDYLTKPFTVQELRETVKSALTKVYPDADFGADSTQTLSDFMVRLPLQDLRDDRFLSSRHRSHFLAFAQNALSDKKRTYETISGHELVKTIVIQFEALGLVNNLDYKITHTHPHLRFDCDMYLLCGALANLALTCMLETRGNKGIVEIAFDEPGEKLQVRYRKAGASLSAKTLETYQRWHQEPDLNLDSNAAMLILTEKVIRLHEGQFNLKTPSGVLAEITLPSHPASAP